MKSRNWILLLLSIALIACQPNHSITSNSKLKIVCTTGMIGDAVSNIVKSNAEVITLMGPGVDPHLYKATQGDLKHLSSADVIIYNGLHLEGKMEEIFVKLSNRKKVIVAANAIEPKLLLNNTDFQGAYDPHLWFDVLLWKKVVMHIGEELSIINDSLREVFLSNSSAYANELNKLDSLARGKLESIDSTKRVLITAHDAFGYFGRAYNIEVKGLQGISTVSEYGLKDITDLVNFIVEKQINAVFIESSVSEKSLEAVVEGCLAKGHEVKIGGKLFSDAMGESGTSEGTYIGMVEHNINTILAGLQ